MDFYVRPGARPSNSFKLLYISKSYGYIVSTDVRLMFSRVKMERIVATSITKLLRISDSLNRIILFPVRHTVDLITMLNYGIIHFAIS
jgi:hypothetical protein